MDLLPQGGARTIAFLGGTIGNFEPAERAAFLRSLRAGLGTRTFLLGADLVKSAEVLVPAYDDAAGVTAAFNLNLLDVLNQRLTPISTDRLRSHRRLGRRERMDRDASPGQAEDDVQLPALGSQVDIDKGEHIRTEISAKFRRDRLTAEMTAAGFVERGWWTDEQEWFSLSLWGAGLRPGVES